MTNPLLSNEINTDSVILWQYDKAYNLIKVLQKWEGFGKASCEDFWNYFGNNILPIDTADTFGLNLWGKLLGIYRPIVGPFSKQWANWDVVNTDQAGAHTIFFIPSYIGMSKDRNRISSLTVQATNVADLLARGRIVQIRDAEDNILDTSTNSIAMNEFSPGTKHTFYFQGNVPLNIEERYAFVFCSTSGNPTNVGIRVGNMSPGTEDLYFREVQYQPGIAVESITEEQQFISDDLYRRLLKARFFMMCHTPTVPNYNKFLSILFGAIENESGESPVYDIFNAEGDIQDGYASRNHVLDFQNMTMGFTFPKDATDEEAYLIFQHYDLVYPFPAGIRYPGEFIDDSKVIGLNENNGNGAAGQFYKNFVDGLVFANENTGNLNGGIFSTSNRANYFADIPLSGRAYIVTVDSDTDTQVSITVRNGNATLSKVWIDWGNGDCGYKFIAGNSLITPTTTYIQKGIYAVIVLCPKDVEIETGVQTEVSFQL